MKTGTTEKGLEAHITQQLCFVNAFKKRNFSHNKGADRVDEDLLFDETIKTFGTF